MSKPGEGIIGTPDDGEPANESEHFEVCPVCGQAFDVRRSGSIEMMHRDPRRT